MLSDFLKKNREEIISKCKAKVCADSESKPTSMLLDQGLPIFYDELIGVLQRTAAAGEPISDSENFHITNRIKKGDAAEHGRESLRLGYSISQVVHSYGAICQSITEFVESKSFNMISREFQDLNYSLDCAIAEAVTEFENEQTKKLDKNEVERLGFLMHEMKNSLLAVSISYEMINSGRVGNTGATSQVLTLSIERMKKLMEGMEKEIRLRGKAEVTHTQFCLIDLINEVETTSKLSGELKKVNLEHDVDPTIQLTTDRDMVFTALLNLINNAMKFTKKDGNVSVRGIESGGRILIEVEDECGGLPDEKTEELFTPFIQKGTDKTGMGLGLSLSRRVIELNKGKLTARNIPGKGCIFTIDLPK
jgi:signal transduction histidine kinase